MTSEPDPPDRPAEGGPLGLDQWVALNDEMAALVRAGVPLERGLFALSEDLRGGLRQAARALAERMSRGEGLAEALEAEGRRFPRLYRAVVVAGLRSGRLPAALEGLADQARRIAETRRTIGLALLYPLIVLMAAYGLLVGFVVAVAPRFQAAFQTLGLAPGRAFGVLTWLGDRVGYWAPVVPALLVLAAVGWVVSGRIALLHPGRAQAVLGRLPGIGRMLRDAQATQFAGLLALLAEHRVPWPDALILAAEGSGDPSLVASARTLAEAARRGEPPRMGGRGSGWLPPYLAWLLAANPEQERLVAALTTAADFYRRRAVLAATWLRVAFPTLVLFGIAGTATLAYGLTLFVPLTRLLEQLARG